jgi:hypothetical protein
LMRASEKGMTGIATMLVNKKASINATDYKHNSGWTALMYASRGGKYGVAQLLVGRKASIDHKEDAMGMNALMWALKNKHVSVAAMLITSKANPYVRNKKGQTPLMLADSALLRQAIAQREQRAMAALRRDVPVVAHVLILDIARMSLLQDQKIRKPAGRMATCKIIERADEILRAEVDEEMRVGDLAEFCDGYDELKWVAVLNNLNLTESLHKIIVRKALKLWKEEQKRSEPQNNGKKN